MKRGCLKKIFQNQLGQSLFLGEIGIQPVEKRKNSAPNLRGRPFASQKVRCFYVFTCYAAPGTSRWFPNRPVCIL